MHNKKIKLILILISTSLLIFLIIVVFKNHIKSIYSNYYNLANKYYNNEKLDDALLNCKKAILINKFFFNKYEHAKSIKLLTDIYLKKTEGGEVIKILEKKINNNKITFNKYDTLYFLLNDNLAKAYFLIGNYEKSLQLFEKTLPEKIEYFGNSHIKVFDAYNNLGVAYAKAGGLNKALKYYSKAIILINNNINMADSCLLLEVYNNLANLYISHNKYSEADIFFKKSLNLIHSCNFRPEKLALIFSNIGNFHYQIGDFDEALKNYNTSLKILKENNIENILLSNIHNNIGNIYNKKGIFANAIDEFNKSLKILSLYYKNHPNYSDIYKNLGNAYYGRGEFYVAKNYYTKAINILKKTSFYDPVKISSLNQNLGIAFIQTNELEKSKKQFHQAINILKSNYGKYHYKIASAYQNISNIFLEENQYDAALDYALKALYIQQNYYNENKDETINRLNLVSEIYLRLNDYYKSREYIKKALLVISNNKSLSFAKSYNILGSIDFNQGNYTEALHAFQNAIYYNLKEFSDTLNVKNNPVINSHKEQGSFDNYDPLILLESLSGKALCYRMIYNNSKELSNLLTAYDIYKKLDTLIENIRFSMKDTDDKLNINEKIEAIYKLAVENCIALHKISNTNEKYNFFEKAYYYTQKAKTNILQELIQESQAKKNLPDSLYLKEKQLKQQLTEYNIKLNLAKSTNDLEKNIDYYENMLFRLNNLYKELIVYFETEFPAYFNYKYNIVFPEISEIQKYLTKNKAIVEYFIGNNTLTIFLIFNSNIKIIHNPVNNLLFNTMNLIYSIKNQDYDNFIIYNSILYNQLFKPVENEIAGIDKLIIIPHNYLFYLPFEALSSDNYKNVPTDFSSANFLIKNYEISYHFSGRLFTSEQKKNTIKPIKENDFIAFAPCIDEEMFIDGMTFKPLKYSLDEVKNICMQYTLNGQKARYYKGKEATKYNFINKSKNYNVIHIATHGISYDENPGLSFLTFYPENNTNELTSNDHVLRLDEVFNHEFTPDLLVLSACETGTGKLYNAEGLMAMTRGFLYAGAKNILYTLWKIDDKTTRDFMIVFYINVLLNKSYSTSVRNAKIKLINKAETSFPFYWSSYVLLGR